MATKKILINAALKTLEVQFNVKCCYTPNLFGTYVTIHDIREILSFSFRKFLELKKLKLEFTDVTNSKKDNPLLSEDNLFLIHNLDILFEQFQKSLHIPFREYYDLNYLFE
jgi:hypothetical protein